MQELANLVADKVGSKLISAHWHFNWLVILGRHIHVAHENAAAQD